MALKNGSDTQADSDRRERLLQAGRELFDDLAAYDDISVAEIAERAGVAHGLLFHYFGSKRRFYVEVVRTALAELASVFDRNPHPPTEPAAWLRWEVAAFVRSAREHGRALQFATRGEMAIDPELVDLFETARSEPVVRLLTMMNVDTPSDFLRGALQGWVAFCLEATPQWVSRGRVSDRRMHQMLISQLVATLHAVAEIEPRSPFEPSIFDDA